MSADVQQEHKDQIINDTSHTNLSTLDCLLCGGRPKEAAARDLLPLPTDLRGRTDPSVVESSKFCGALAMTPDVQQEHEENNPLPAGLGEGVIEQRSVVAFSSANAEPPTREVFIAW